MCIGRQRDVFVILTSSVFQRQIQPLQNSITVDHGIVDLYLVGKAELLGYAVEALSQFCRTVCAHKEAGVEVSLAGPYKLESDLSLPRPPRPQIAKLLISCVGYNSVPNDGKRALSIISRTLSLPKHPPALLCCLTISHGNCTIGVVAATAPATGTIS